MITLDCTLRDGGYYNHWDFPFDIVNEYLAAMSAAGVDVVEIGMRSLINKGFKGASAFSAEEYLSSLKIPASLQVAVMINASELADPAMHDQLLSRLFPARCEESAVDIVRVACHVYEFEGALPISNWLHDKGFKVCFNIMQISDRSDEEIVSLAEKATKYPIEVLYFADSMGSMKPYDAEKIIKLLRQHWTRELGIHTHDNMGLALQNTLCSLDAGVTWLDATVTGMGRGPGNARTEELVIETALRTGRKFNLVPLMSLIRKYFQPLKNKCGWGTNPYYYLSGKYGIHPTYIQEMLADSRYSEEDILAAINHLKEKNGKKFSLSALDSTRNFHSGRNDGVWEASKVLEGREVLILGAGSGVSAHKSALESYIRARKPFVMALNTQSAVDQSLIDIRVACHPVRLLADCQALKNLPQPLVTPVGMLPADMLEALDGKNLLDFGLTVVPEVFEFRPHSATVPNSLVVSYALAIAASGKSSCVRLAGFDGYGADDPRSKEMQLLFDVYRQAKDSVELISVTPTSYNIPVCSVYAM